MEEHINQLMYHLIYKYFTLVYYVMHYESQTAPVIPYA